MRTGALSARVSRKRHLGEADVAAVARIGANRSADIFGYQSVFSPDSPEITQRLHPIAGVDLNDFIGSVGNLKPRLVVGEKKHRISMHGLAYVKDGILHVFYRHRSEERRVGEEG